MRNSVFAAAAVAASMGGAAQEAATKLPMGPDAIVRLSRVEVLPEWREHYVRYAAEVGTTSLRVEPGVLVMYAMSEIDDPCVVTIVEIYANCEAYAKHVASAHFQKYKQGTLHMVKKLTLTDQKPLNPSSRLSNAVE